MYLLVQNDLDPLRMYRFRHIQHVVQPPVGRCGQGASRPTVTAPAPVRVKAEHRADLARDGAGYRLRKSTTNQTPSAISGGGGGGGNTLGGTTIVVVQLEVRNGFHLRRWSCMLWNGMLWQGTVRRHIESLIPDTIRNTMLRETPSEPTVPSPRKKNKGVATCRRRD